MTRIVEWIEAKKDGKALPDEAIRALVAGFTTGEIPDYQMSALLMAVAIRGMTGAETLALTRAMVASGDILDLSVVSGTKIDKHSTGGVGDKVTLALVPIVAAAAVPIAKMSGHGLGLTGGTLDKLESIPGFRTELSEEEIVDQVSRIGACICSQTDRLAPADRAMYALRDVTGSVASIPLIASSIMSKKIACGADAILLDVKVGSGAFMKDVAQARDLAEACMTIATAFGKRMSVFLTDMDQPLGRAIGNLNEVYEVIDLLRSSQGFALKEKPLSGELDNAPVGWPGTRAASGCRTRRASMSSDTRLHEITMILCREALRLGGKSVDPAKIVDSGAAIEKFAQVIEAQGGDRKIIDAANNDTCLCMIASDRAGYVQHVDALKIAQLAAHLGAGREKKGDAIDPTAGVYLHKVQGEKVAVGEAIAAIGSRRLKQSPADYDRQLQDAFTIGSDKPEPQPVILDHFTSDDRQYRQPL